MGNICSDDTNVRPNNSYEYLPETKNQSFSSPNKNAGQKRMMLRSMNNLEDENVVSSSNHFPSSDIAEMDTIMNEPHPENIHSFTSTSIWTKRDNKKSIKNPSTGYKKCFRYLDTNLTYQGQYLNGLKEGLGTEISEMGEIYTGNFHNDLRHGSGVLIQINGDVIIANFVNDEAEGPGESSNSRTKIRYKGTFVDSRKEGEGEEEGENGYRYKGQFHEGYKNGEGELFLPNGDHYIGKFLNNKFHGPGTLIYGEESVVKKYEGEFRGGKWHGIGTVEFKDGRVFEGECVSGGINGYGIMFYPGVGVYEGEFSDGMKEGFGVFSDFRSGRKSKGRYDDDRLIESMAMDKEDKNKAEWKKK